MKASGSMAAVSQANGVLEEDGFIACVITVSTGPDAVISVTAVDGSIITNAGAITAEVTSG
jgi:hypothetical protein